MAGKRNQGRLGATAESGGRNADAQSIRLCRLRRRDLAGGRHFLLAGRSARSASSAVCWPIPQRMRPRCVRCTFCTTAAISPVDTIGVAGGSLGVPLD